jgi:hypothetical protein
VTDPIADEIDRILSSMPRRDWRMFGDMKLPYRHVRARDGRVEVSFDGRNWFDQTVSPASFVADGRHPMAALVGR